MKILAVSDVVNRRLYSPLIKEIAGSVDLIVSCGDLPDYYLDYIVSNLCKPLLYVCGNHDHYEQPKHKTRLLGNGETFYNVALDYNRSGSNFGGKNMDMKTEIIGSTLFTGLEGSNMYNHGDHQYTQGQMKRRISSLALKFLWNRLKYGRNLDVLITHAPPWGIHDQNDLPHQGFKSYLSLIKKYKPKYLLHGHTHLYNINEKRVTEYMGTQIINCYDYQILDLKIDEE